MRKEITERELASLIKQFNLDEMPEEPSDEPTFEAEGDNVLEKGELQGTAGSRSKIKRLS